MAMGSELMTDERGAMTGEAVATATMAKGSGGRNAGEREPAREAVGAMADEAVARLGEAVAMATMAEGSGGAPQGWRYVYEALHNVRALQLLLFQPTLTPVHDCANFTAVVRHGSLCCAWDSPQGAANSLAVPLPACLLDLSRPARCWTRRDHVEVRLGLLSLDPALFQLGLEDESPDSGSRGRDNAQPFSVEFDAQALEISKAVQFYCRKCSCKLTKTPFRRVLEVPSMDWREVSEHFYGNCCCASFGAQTEFLVTRFQELLTPSEETCLVASTTCIVHEGDVIASEGDSDASLEPIAAQPLGSGKNDSDPSAVSHPGVESHIGVETARVNISGYEGWKQQTSGSPSLTCVGDHVDCNSSGHYSNKLSVTPGTDSKLIHNRNVVEETTLVSVAEEIQEVCVDGSEVSPEESESRTHHFMEEDPCCSSSCSSRKPAPTESSAMKEVKEPSPESLGNGFMTGPGSQSEVRDWEPFLCRSCSSLVGARRCDSSKKGVQFFKYKISTHESVLSSSNIFREHTLERLFTHELEKNTESNSSYRYVVRSFQTGAALLQLVLLNQSALVSSGMCHPITTSNCEETAVETTKPKFLDSASGCQAGERNGHQTLDWKPVNVSFETVAKFMFCDCRMLNSDELRLIDKWAQLQNADEIFMLEEVAGILVDLLKVHQMAYPTSCQSFQQLGLSFLIK